MPNFIKCSRCDHVLNPLAEDDCDRVFVLPSGDLYCPDCFLDYLKDELDTNLDAFAEALGYPILYTERSSI